MKAFLLGAAILGIAAAASAQSGEPMTQDELVALTEGGTTISLGGPGMGYAGTLDLAADGTGSGTARTDGGDEITLTGTWRIADGQFCRSWQEFDDGAEVCETWVRTGENSADVMVGGNRIGANSW